MDTVKYKFVYRVEDKKTGYGPFNSNKMKIKEILYYYVYYRCACGVNLKNWEYDIKHVHKIKNEYHKYISGCKDKRQLKHWFTPEILTQLKKYKFSIVVYKVPETDILTGSVQVIFKKETAIKVKTLDYSEL